MTATFQPGSVPVKEAGDPSAAGVVPVVETAAGAGVVPVHVVTSDEAGVVPIEIKVSGGAGIVPVHGTA